MLLNQIKALALLTECRGDEIWSVAYCEEAGVPQPWIEQLSDAFESGFKFDRDTIYVEGEVVNQYYGVSDRDIAFKLAEFFRYRSLCGDSHVAGANSRSTSDQRSDRRTLISRSVQPQPMR